MGFSLFGIQFGRAKEKELDINGDLSGRHSHGAVAVSGGAQKPSMFRHAPAQQQKQKITSLVGDGAVFVGDLSTRESAHISGRLVGSLIVRGEGAAASVSSTGEIEGNVQADVVLVGGRVVGTIRAKSLRIFESGEVEGDVFCERLLVDDGGNLFGRSHRLENAASKATGAIESTSISEGVKLSGEQSESDGTAASPTIIPIMRSSSA